MLRWATRRYFRHWTLMAGIGISKLPKEVQDKTSLTSHHGLFRFTRLLFGLKNAPGTFQRVINFLLTKGQMAVCPCLFLDETFIFSHTLEDHIDHGQRMLPVSHDMRVTLNLKNLNPLRIESIFSVISFALGPSKFRYKQWTPYTDWKARPP